MKKNIKKIFVVVVLMFIATTVQASEITGKLSTGVSPATPSGLITSSPNQGDTEITITWNSVSFVGGYNLYRITGTNSAVFITNTTSTNYSDSGLSDGNYSYQIESYLGNLTSEKSAPTSPVTINTTVTTNNNGGGGGSSGGGGGGGGGGIVTTPSTADYDFNSDGNIDVFDFNILIVNWGNTTAIDKTTGDANGDGNVDIFDFNLLIINWQS